MIRAIIFDVDGVLLDNRSDVIKVFQETGRRLDLKIPSVPEIKSNFGLPWEEMLTNLFGKTDKNIMDVFLRTWEEFEGNMKIMDDTEYVLERLKIRKAIMTSKPKTILEKQLGKLMKFFEVVVSKEDTSRHKPNPEPLLLACKKLGISPEEAVYIGDTIIDCQASKSAGMSFIGFI